MHTTPAGEKRKTLKKEAQALTREAKAARKAAKTLPEASQKASELESQAANLKAEAEALKGAARLEDLHIWQMWQMQKSKTAKKGKTTYGYWMASWREGNKTRNMHLGSSRKMDAEEALQKARKMKAEALHVN